MIVLLLDERTRDDKYLFKLLGMSKRLSPHIYSKVPFLLGKEE